jgi:tryptophan synthase alpha chain
MTQVNNTSPDSTCRYQNTFNELKEKKQKAFIPFVVIGDPNADQSFELIKTLIDNGADALELGIPFSDPSADGKTIQKAALRAINAGINTNVCIDIIKKVRAYSPSTPIGLLLYGNLVFARGIDNFYRDMKEAGVDSVLIADVPLRESLPFRKSAAKYGIAPIFIVPPNASEDTLKEVASFSRGYTYVLSRAGVTGVDTDTGELNKDQLSDSEQANEAVSPAQHLIEKLSLYKAAPAVLGFGISTPAQIKEALKAGALGAISGSAVVKVIEDNLDSPETMLTEMGKFISDMKSAT